MLVPYDVLAWKPEPITGKINGESHACLRRCNTGSINLNHSSMEVQRKNSMQPIGAVASGAEWIMLRQWRSAIHPLEIRN